MNEKNIKTEYPDEELYRQEIMSDIPDLWDRIDKGIDALENKSDSAVSEKVTVPAPKGKVFDFKRFAVYAAPVAALLLIVGLALPVLNNASKRSKNYSASAPATADMATAGEDYAGTESQACYETAEAVAEECEDTDSVMKSPEKSDDNERSASEVKGNSSMSAAANANSSAASFSYSATPDNADMTNGESAMTEMEEAADSYPGNVILVSFDEGVTEEQKIAIRDKYGLEMVYDYKYMNLCSYSCPNCEDLNKLCENIAKEENVISAEIEGSEELNE